jgi:hypothetical protein
VAHEEQRQSNAEHRAAGRFLLARVDDVPPLGTVRLDVLAARLPRREDAASRESGDQTEQAAAAHAHPDPTVLENEHLRVRVDLARACVPLVQLGDIAMPYPPYPGTLPQAEPATIYSCDPRIALVDVVPERNDQVLLRLRSFAEEPVDCPLRPRFDVACAHAADYLGVADEQLHSRDGNLIVPIATQSVAAVLLTLPQR